MKGKIIYALSLLLILLNAYLMNFNNKIDESENVEEITPVFSYVNNENISVNEKEDLKVYDGKTLEEVAQIIENSLNSTIKGKGYLIASYSIEKGVDPYLATAIMLHETGCKWGCSKLVLNCNNVGGQKGKGCGSYAYFNSLDEGIKAFIDNIYKNYVCYGLTTPDTMNPKYAEDPNWAYYVNKYIETLKAH